MDDYLPVHKNVGVLMSPIQSEKKKSNVPVYSFTWFDIIVIIISMGTYIADIVTDILVTLVYWKLDEKTWAGLTLAFLIVPSIVMQIFSTRWYMADGHRITLSTFLIHMFMMGPILRYVSVLKCGFRARKTKRIEDYQAMYSELSDVSMLRLFESFLESAPQLVLQLYIMIKVVEEDHILTGIAAFFSLISLSWAIAAYTKALRTAVYSQDSPKKRVSWSGLALQTIWRVGMVAGRIIALVLFATVYPIWLLVGVGVHWFIMTIWLVAQDTDFCGTWWEERLFNAVVGVIHIFCFFNMKEGRSRWRMVAFYLIILIENSAMILLWFPHRTEEMWFNIPALVTVWGGFLIGLVSMVLYYQFFHPSSPRKCHCCMLYYHLVYRCCPCNALTTYHATPYKRNIANDRSSSDSGDSDCDKYRPVSGVYNEKMESSFRMKQEMKTVKVSFGKKGIGSKLFRNKFTSSVCGDDAKNVKLMKLKPLESPQERNNGKKLKMPKPKATSTPGDDLDEKYERICRIISDCEVIEQENSNENYSLSTSSLEDISFQEEANMTRDNFSLIRNQFMKKERGEGFVTSTPSVLKNLPGASNGPCTNKGNSTLVREWVKKTQDMHQNPCEGVKKNQDKHKNPSSGGRVSFDITEEQNYDFGTWRSTAKGERDFMEKHFGDGVQVQPSGRRDILRMKSFGKKERQRRAPVDKRRGRKRRRSSFNITDIRNSFREAFGFHAIDVDQVRPQVVESENEEIEMEEKPRHGTTRDWMKRNDRKMDPEWPETDMDYRIGENALKGERKNFEEFKLENEENQKPLNLILARIDQPPVMKEIEMQGIRSNAGKQNLHYLVAKKMDVKLGNSAGNAEKRENCMNLGKNNFDWTLNEMETLHGTAAPESLKRQEPLKMPEPLKSDELTEQTKPLKSDKDAFLDISPDLAKPKPLSKLIWKKPAADLVRLEPSAGSLRLQGAADSVRIEAKPIAKVAEPAVLYDDKPDSLSHYDNIHKENNVVFHVGGESLSDNIKHDTQLSVPEKSVYDNLTASDILNKVPEEVNDESEETQGMFSRNIGQTVAGVDHINNIPEMGTQKVKVSKPVFGPVIQVIGDKVKVTHQNETKTELISKPAIKEESVLKPVFMEPPRRDRIEYLYKMGRHGLMKAAEDSPARKRLSFKKESTAEYVGWSDSEEENIVEDVKEKKSVSHFVEKVGYRGEEERNSCEKTGKKKKDGLCEEKDKKMEKSIEALGASMEGVIDEEENYTVHIRDKLAKSGKSKNFAKILGGNQQGQQVLKDRTKSARFGSLTNSSKCGARIVKQRKTLGAVENLI